MGKYCGLKESQVDAIVQRPGALKLGGVVFMDSGVAGMASGPENFCLKIGA